MLIHNIELYLYQLRVATMMLYNILNHYKYSQAKNERYARFNRFGINKNQMDLFIYQL